jgi:LAO/AO transport system kinase
LSDTTPEIVQLFEAAGKDVILIETVGIGQSEVEIAHEADVVLTVLTPAGGDEIQVFKAGIIEVTDIFVINKADLEGAETKITEIRSYFSPAEKPPIVIPVSARTGEGIGALTDAVLDFARSHTKRAADRDRIFHKNLVLEIILQKISDRIGADGELRRLLESEEPGNPFVTAERIYARLTKGGIDGQADPAHRHRGPGSG